MRLRLVALAFLASNANLTLPAKSFATQDIPAESPECRERFRWIKAEFKNLELKSQVLLSQSTNMMTRQ
jgi:hypothetical protein